MKKCNICFIIFFTFISLNCTNLKNSFKLEKKSCVVNGIYNNYFKNNYLIVCSNKDSNYLILSDLVCKDSNKSNIDLIKVNDVINITISPIEKPQLEDFIFERGVNFQQKISLFLIFKDSTLNESIGIATQDSILGNYYRSPDICGKYLIYR